MLNCERMEVSSIIEMDRKSKMLGYCANKLHFVLLQLFPWCSLSLSPSLSVFPFLLHTNIHAQTNTQVSEKRILLFESICRQPLIRERIPHSL